MASPDVDRERCARSFASFVRLAWEHTGDPQRLIWNWHLGAIADECQAITDGEILRSVVNIPPGSGKSTLTGVLWPAWVWGPLRDPGARWMFASYDQSLMLRDARRLETLLSSAWYRERWGEILTPGARALHDLRTRAGGGRFSTSMQGKALGRHAHYQVIDDPIKATDAAPVTGLMLDKAKETIEHTFATRAIDPPRFRRMIIGQRIHEADPSQWAIDQGWHRLRLPMLAELDDLDPRDPRTVEGAPLFPERWPAAWCAEFARLSPDVWATQYQQTPASKTGAIWPEDLIELHAVNADEVPTQRPTASVQSWDLTFKGAAALDWVAGQWWSAYGDHLYLRGHLHEPLSFVATVETMQARAPVWPAERVLIEDKANGPAVEDVIKGKLAGVELVTPRGSKTARAHAAAPYLKAGRIHIVRGEGYATIKRIFTRFPAVRRDDPVDAATQAILTLTAGANWLDALDRLRSPS